MFGAASPGFDWEQVVENRQTVLLDFRGEHDLERRRFKMFWSFSYFLEYIKHRGPGRHQPVSMIIDELTALTNLEALGQSVFGADLDELINVIARNYMVWLTIAHQEMWQVDERIQKTLMTMGTQMLGVTTDPEARINLARQLFNYDPNLVKKHEPVWMSNSSGAYVVDYRSVEFTPQEQELLRSYLFSEQGRFEFLVRLAPKEGDLRGELRQISLDGIDTGIYPNDKHLAQVREKLMQYHGREEAAVLAEIETRHKPLNGLSQNPKSSKKKDAGKTDIPPAYG
jgi:hypothetical protein